MMIHKIILLIVISIMSSGCHQYDSDSLVGRWEWAEGAGDESMSFVFTEKNEFVYADSSSSFSGTYHIISESIIELHLENGSIDQLNRKANKIYLGGSYPVVFEKE